MATDCHIQQRGFITNTFPPKIPPTSLPYYSQLFVLPDRFPKIKTTYYRQIVRYIFTFIQYSSCLCFILYLLIVYAILFVNFQRKIIGDPILRGRGDKVLGVRKSSRVPWDHPLNRGSTVLLLLCFLRR